MRTISKRISALLAVLAVVLCLAVPSSSYAATDISSGRVLFISSYAMSWDFVEEQIAGVRSALSDDVFVDYSFMDTISVGDDTGTDEYYRSLAYKLSIVAPYDALVVADDAAFRFVMEHREELFSGIPVVFLGINDASYAAEVSVDRNICGVIEDLPFKECIDLAVSVCPRATRVVNIFDGSLTSEIEKTHYYSLTSLYPKLALTDIDSSEISTQDLASLISGYGDETILIHSLLTRDGSGRQYSLAEAARFISRNAHIPVWRTVDGGIGGGVLGGCVASMRRSGELAGQMVSEVLRGRRLPALTVKSPSVYRIDEKVMQEYNLSRSQFPKGTVYVNHDVNFFERYQVVLIPLVIMLAVMAVFTIWISVDNVKRRKLMKELSKARNILENASQHDFLTELPNRAKFMEDIKVAFERRAPVTLYMLDIDHFKHINDTYGHAAGDEALKVLAGRLAQLESDLFTPYRLAGDEFICILLSDNYKIVDSIAVQILGVFQKPFTFAGDKHDVHGSIGIASYPANAADSEGLMSCADAAMYQVKLSGRNAYRYYQPGDEEKDEERDRERDKEREVH